MPENPTRKKQKLPVVKDRLDKDGRATASAMTGHLRNKGDDRTYRWGRLPDFASPERPGVSGGLAPHHVLGLKRFAALTYGMSPEDITDLNDNYMPPGRRMGEDNRYNYEYVEQDVKGKEGTMSGWHKKIHKSQDDLFEKMGFTTDKAGELYFYSQRFADMDPEMQKGIISHVAVQFDNDFDRVMKLASDEFYNRPPEVVEAELADIRKRGETAPPRPAQDFRPTPKSSQVVMDENWAQLNDPKGWEKIQAADLSNKQLQHAAQNPGLSKAARLLGYSSLLPAAAMLPIQAKASQEADELAQKDPTLMNKAKALVEKVSLEADKVDAVMPNPIAGGVSNAASVASLALDTPDAIKRNQQDLADRRENGVENPQVSLVKHKAATLMDQNNFGNRVNNFLQDPVGSTNQGLKNAWGLLKGMLPEEEDQQPSALNMMSGPSSQ